MKRLFSQNDIEWSDILRLHSVKCVFGLQNCMKGLCVKVVITWIVAKLQEQILSSVLKHFKELSIFSINHDTSNNFLKAVKVFNNKYRCNKMLQVMEEILIIWNIGTAGRLKLGVVGGWGLRKWTAENRWWVVTAVLDYVKWNPVTACQYKTKWMRMEGNTKYVLHHQFDPGGNAEVTHWMFPGEYDLEFLWNVSFR